MAREFNLDMCFQNCDDIIKLVKADSPIVREVIEGGFITTKQTKEISSLQWRDDKLNTMVTFRSMTTLLTQNDV